MAETGPTGFFTSLHRAAACDAALLRRYPKLLWSWLGAMLVPALYAAIVLFSVWDPNSRLALLPVGLVNQDTGLKSGAREVNLGAEVLKTLSAQALFSYREFSDADEARRAVREGRLAFAVMLPPDFSSRAMLGVESGAGHVILYLSEGNNYASAGLAKRFAPELAHRVNEALNERRWALVFDSNAGSHRDLATLRQGVDQLVNGARHGSMAMHRAREGAQAVLGGLTDARDAGQQLRAATAQLAEGAAQSGVGLRQLDSGLRAISARTPPERDLQALHLGGRTLLQGHAELGAGLQQLRSGAGTLRDGTVAFKLEAGELPFVGERMAQVAGALQAGAEQLERGLDTALGAQGRLAEGTQRLVDASEQLADGLLHHGAAINQLVARLPDEAHIERFAAGAADAAAATARLADGLRQLHDGQARLQSGLVQLDNRGSELATGLRLLQASLPAAKPLPEGTPGGLAQSVQPELQVVAAVGSEGAGFSPNFVPLALWMGAVMAAFLFHFRRLPADLVGAPHAATVAGRLVFPTLLVVGQALLMLAMLVGVLQLPVQRVLPVSATLLMASMLFLCLIFVLVHLFGDVGKLVAVLLLVVQMSAAGALLPVELTPPLFQAMHRWLPLSWVVQAFRASLFGAYDGAWANAWTAMVATGASALALAVVFGRWQPMPAAAYRPTMEVD